jgi:hypothetical protein
MKPPSCFTLLISVFSDSKPSLFNNIYCLCSPGFRLKAGMTEFGRGLIKRGITVFGNCLEIRH